MLLIHCKVNVIYETSVWVHIIGLFFREEANLIWRHIKHYELNWELLTTKWFICLFAEVLPIEVSSAWFMVIFLVRNCEIGLNHICFVKL